MNSLSNKFSKVNTNRFKNNGNVLSMIKPIQQTPELTGTFAQEFLKEVLKKPSAASIERNKKAQDLLRRMKR